ncbi:hypothetical protein V6Z11_A01G106700 [Gossypium hirsutum]
MNKTAFSMPPNLNPDQASPDWMNKGDNAWQLTAATLVGLQSIPGLLILYGGSVKKKWAVNSAFMVLYAFAFVILCWAAWGYRFSFGDKMIPFWGKPNFALDGHYLMEQTFLGNSPTRQCIWCPDGFLAKMGIIDYSGGYVIHLSSGVAGFTAAYWVGPRLTQDRQRFPPNNILLMLFGAGLLWIGWTGFNGGDPYVVSVDASLAVINTHICTAASLLTWLLLDIVFFRKPSVIGAVQGMITGLVCITPAAGVVQGWAAVIMGLCSGSIPWFTMMVIHKRSEMFQKVDDTMAVLHTHAIAGSLGGILSGIFAVPKLNRLFYGTSGHYIGLFYGLATKRTHDGFRQIGVQLIGVVFVVVLNIVSTSIICVVVQIFMPLRMSEEEMEIGDEAAHGEEAYAIWGDEEEKLDPKYELAKSKAGGQMEMV